MNIKDLLRKTGVMRSGAVAGTYTNAKDRPTELMMDGVYNAEKDLVINKNSSSKPPEPTASSGDGAATPPAAKPSKWRKNLLITTAVLVGLFLLAAIFGTPSAEQVFSDSLDKMLQTKSVNLTHDLSVYANKQESVKLQSESYMDLRDNDQLRAKGDFSVDITTQGIPVVAEADYIALDGGKYIKFSQLSTTEPAASQGFLKAETAAKGKWIKARTGDNFASFAQLPIDILTGLTPLPFANLNDDDRQEVVKILRDDESYTIKESSRVTVSGTAAYRYELTFDKKKQEEVANKLRKYIDYIAKDSGDDNSEVTKLELWVDINTKQFIKMEYSGTSEQGDISAVITFSEYDKEVSVDKPDEYFIESEIVQ